MKKKTEGCTDLAAAAAHDPQAGGKYRLVICEDCGAAFVASRRQHEVRYCPKCRETSEFRLLARENAAILAAQTGREMAKRARLRAADARWNAAVANTVPVTRREGRNDTIVETRGRCGGVCSAPRTVRIADVSPLESAWRRGLTGAQTNPWQRKHVADVREAARRRRAANRAAKGIATGGVSRGKSRDGEAEADASA